MAATVAMNVQLILSATQQNPLTLATISDPMSERFTDSTTAGTGSQQTDRLWFDTRTLSNTSELLPLQAGPVIGNPPAPPVLTDGGAGSLGAGTWQVAYSYVTARGQTMVSPAASITLAAAHQIAVAGITPLPAGATGVNWYVSASAGSGTLLLGPSNNGAGFNINAAGSGAAVPGSNTARGTVTGGQTANGVLIDPLGAEFSVGHVKGILVWNKTAAQGGASVQGDILYVGNAPTNPFGGDLDSPTARRKIDAGDCYMHWQPLLGVAVTLNGNDMLKIDSSGAAHPVTYDIIIWGTST